MRGGFLLGSLALIVTYVLVQDGVAGRVDQAQNVFTALLRRVMSPDAAGIGDHTKRPAQPAPSGGAGGSPKFT